MTVCIRSVSVLTLFCGCVNGAWQLGVGLRRLGGYDNVGAILGSSYGNGFTNATTGPSDEEGPSCKESGQKGQ